MQTLLDLDAGRLPQLTVRLDGRDFAVCRPESLPLRDALRLGELLTNMTDPTAAPNEFDAAVLETVALITPDIADAMKSQRAIGLARSIVVFYTDHLARAVERLGADAAETHANTPPFFIGPRPLSDAPKSRPVFASASGNNS